MKGWSRRMRVPIYWCSRLNRRSSSCRFSLICSKRKMKRWCCRISLLRKDRINRRIKLEKLEISIIRIRKNLALNWKIINRKSIESLLRIKNSQKHIEFSRPSCLRRGLNGLRKKVIWLQKYSLIQKWEENSMLTIALWKKSINLENRIEI